MRRSLIGPGSGGVRWGPVVNKDEAAGLRDGTAVEFQAAIGYQVGHHGLGGAGGKGFAIGQPVAQINRSMPPEEWAARIFGRPHAPLAPRPTAFPNLPFDLINGFVMNDRHNYLRFVSETPEVPTVARAGSVAIRCPATETGHESCSLRPPIGTQTYKAMSAPPAELAPVTSATFSA